MAVENCLGDIAIAGNVPVKHESDKLASVQPNSEEGFYMLATYCFDLQRKMEYLFKATQEYAGQARPALAKQIKAHNDSIHADGISWQERAKRAQAAMIQLYLEVRADHEKALSGAARKP